ncbi:MAG TPA: hypothetical protein PKH64_09970 [Petrotogaceae bacterium]|mgnify:FL=1|nr:hypothetical protein [Petrotogaceae bacterium]
MVCFKKIIIFFSFFISGIIFSFDIPYSHLEYTEIIDSLSYKNIIDISTEDSSICLNFSCPGKKYTVICNEDLMTTYSFLKNTEKDSFYEIALENYTIHITSYQNGYENHYEYLWDGNTPWIQAIELSMVNFIKSDSTSMRFWLINPSDGKKMDMIAIKEGIYQLDVLGKKENCTKVKVTLDSFLSIFWSVSYWFRNADGLFVRYEGLKGGPASPKKHISILNYN